MGFPTEPSGYEKGIFTDLQGAWESFRHAVVESGGFEGADRVLFHTDEAMSWETVRNLGWMPDLLLVVRNLCVQGNAGAEVMESLEILTGVHDEVQELRRQGSIL
jgi:hypothetical protein